MGTVTSGVLLDERYRIVERRAAGATATVWEAEDDFLRRRVALKILHEHLASDADLLSRFVDEARAAATVNHPALVAVYDSIVDQPGLVLEWIDGPDLRQRLDLGPMGPDDVIALGIAISGGLAALHEHGLIHRDVKPANILLTAEGHPKLTDFGIATANAGDRTATGIVLGTAKYLAPEQVRGTTVDGRADVFALAAVLYEAVAGRPPWQRDGDLPTALARLEEDAPDLRRTHPAVPTTLTDAIMRGLAREPDDRWPSADVFAEALGGNSRLPAPPQRPAETTRIDVRSTPVPAPRQAPTSVPLHHRPVRRRRRRWPRLAGLIVGLAIAALGWTLISAITRSPAPGPGLIGAASPIRIASAEAFDPEGSGPPGEHNELAPAAVDGDPDTAWVTERYADRGMGDKSGVGLVLTLDAVHDLSAVTIHTAAAQDWAVDLHVATGVPAAEANGVADYGARKGGGTGLDPSVELGIDGRGDTLVLWFTDLGTGRSEGRSNLDVLEVTIR